MHRGARGLPTADLDMFTGIIREVGTVTKAQRTRGLLRVTIVAPRTADIVQPLESIAINGACLSAVSVHRPTGTIVFEVIPPTQRLTTLPSLRAGDAVHVEPSLALSDRIGAHLVLGHVDERGVVVTRQQRAGELILGIRVGRSVWSGLLVPQGPIAVDGVSLTVGRLVARATFTIHLIPETLRSTTLRQRRIGDGVNIEYDYLGKLVMQFLTAARPSAPPTGRRNT